MPAKKNVNPPESVVALETSVGETLMIRSNPTDDEVRGYVQEQTRRYLAGEPGGPSGLPAFRIFNAKRYGDEVAALAEADPISEVEIQDLLPTP